MPHCCIIYHTVSVTLGPYGRRISLGINKVDLFLSYLIQPLPLPRCQFTNILQRNFSRLNKRCLVYFEVPKAKIRETKRKMEIGGWCSVME